ncbi:MAG: Mur ligase family protein, partial [Rhodospirillaceae bacterium]|nr:Mur ligase family protein [Rhodospirillaceae bacterium]
MARGWRKNFPVPVVAVTGSNGKTTVKELIAGILGRSHDVCVTRGNLNNDLGVPLTLMELADNHEILVIELGANHAGEIAALSQLVRPTVGVITNAGAAHLEGFGSIDGVARAKGELLDHLPAAGTAILNADDPYCSAWRRRSHAAGVLTFGFEPSADCTVRGEVADSSVGSVFTLELP